MWIGRGCSVSGRGGGGEGSEGAGSVVVEGADEEGLGWIVDCSHPFGGEGDAVGSPEPEDGSDGLVSAEGGPLGEFGPFCIVSSFHSRAPRSG